MDELDHEVALRPADETECAFGGMTPQQAVAHSVASSTVSKVMRLDGEPVAYWGWVAPSALGVQCWAWLLTTPLADSVPFVMAIGARREIDALRAHYPIVSCFVHPSHLTAIRWLHWLNFSIIGELDGFYIMSTGRKN